MKSKNLIYKYKVEIRNIALLILLCGIVLTYFYYGEEVYETIGGFLCGIGLGLLLITLGVKKRN